MKPKIVVTETAAIEISNRVRSSRRWSTSDIVPSGLTRLRRRRGSSRRRKPGVFTGGFQWGRGARRMVPARRASGRPGVGGLLVGSRRVDPLGLHKVGLSRRGILRLALMLQLANLRLEDPHRLSE